MTALQPTTAVTTDGTQSHNSTNSSSSVPTTDAGLGCYSESGSTLLLANMLVVASSGSSSSSRDSSSSTALTTAMPDCVLSLEQHVQSLWPLVQKAAAAGGSRSETSTSVTAANGHATAVTTAGTSEQSSAAAVSAAQGVLRYVSQLGAALSHHLAQQAQQDITQLQVCSYMLL
jgi:hypothetical protein